jgi:hypothetical protein
MLRMRRTSLVRACVLALAISAFAASPAIAAIIELGATKTALIAPTCPAGVAPKDCTIVLTQVTALETVRDGKVYPTTVKQAGVIVAFTVGLSRLSPNNKTAKAFIHTLDSNYGGTTRAAIAILHPVGPRGRFQWKVVAESPVVHLQPYLGQVVQFPLPRPLPVTPGDAVALTVPTWAPVLSIDLSAPNSPCILNGKGCQFAYRQSRSTGCSTTPLNSAQGVGQTTIYGCNYRGARVEYSATEITNPVAVNPIH